MIKHNFLKQIGLGLGVALAVVVGFGTSAQAQYQADDGYQSNEKDGGVYGDAPSGLNPLDIMHRAQQSNGRSATEFNEESQIQIDSSASDFKRLQQQRILERQQPRQTQELEAAPTVK